MTDLHSVIPWVLERIADGDYTVNQDSEGQIKSIEIDPFYGEMGKRFEVVESALLASMPAENRNAFLSLKQGYHPEELANVMGRLFPGAGEFLSERLDGATWEELVRWLDYIYEAAWNGEGEWEGMQQRDPWINGPKRVRM